MITHNQQKFLFEILENNGKITKREQSVFVNTSGFYNTITYLNNLKLINIFKIKKDNKIYSVYELTLRGLTLIKILNGEDY